jgi:hypothetical protein
MPAADSPTSTDSSRPAKRAAPDHDEEQPAAPPKTEAIAQLTEALASLAQQQQLQQQQNAVLAEQNAALQQTVAKMAGQLQQVLPSLPVQAKERVVELCGQQQTEDETALKTTLKELFTDTAVPEEEANAEAAAAFDSYESALAVHIDPEVLTLCGYEVRDAMDILWCRCMWIVIGSCYLLIAFPESGNQAGKQFVAVWAAVACLLTVNALIHAYYYSSTKYMNAKPHYIDTTRVRAMCVRAMLAWGFFPIVYALCLFVGLMIGNTNAKHLFVGPLCFVLVWLVPCGMVVCMCFSLGRDLTKRADLQGELRARLSRCGASNSGRPMDGEEVSLLKPIATRKLAPEQRLVVELPPADQPSTPMVQVVASLDV